MKVGTLLIAAMLCTTVAGKAGAYAGDLGHAAKALTTMSEHRIETAKKSYLEALNSPNDGVVQSAIGIVLQWRLINPQEDLSKIERKISDLALNGSCPEVRFKASLASLVMDNPAVVNFDAASCDDCTELFDAITGSLRQMMIGHSLH
jgi:hypothetical protein